MPKLTIYPMGESIEMRRGESVRDALYRAGIELDSPCNGQGICGKCQVRVENPELFQKTPHPDISPEQEAAGVRLACQLTPRKDITVHLLSAYTHNAYRILEGQRYPDDREAEEGRRNLTAPERKSPEGWRPAVRVTEAG